MGKIIKSFIRQMVCNDFGKKAIDNSLVFEMLFLPGFDQPGLVCNTSGGAYDYLTPLDEINGNETYFPAGTPVITHKGLRGSSGYTCYFLNSKSPVTQDITFAAAGTYTLYHYGAGSVSVSGASTGDGTDAGAGTGIASDGLTFTTASAGMTVSFTVSGAVDRCQVNSGTVAMPFVPVLATNVSIHGIRDMVYSFLGSDLLNATVNSDEFEFQTKVYIPPAGFSGSGVSLFRDISSFAWYLDGNHNERAIFSHSDGLYLSGVTGTFVPGESEFILSYKNNVFKNIGPAGINTSPDPATPIPTVSGDYYFHLENSNFVGCAYIKFLKVYNEAKSW